MAHERQRPVQQFGPALIGLCLSLLIYVLSFGPACALNSRGHISNVTIETAYYPLICLAERSDTFALALQSYSELWLPPAVADCAIPPD